MIYDHTDPEYAKTLEQQGLERYNGAYYYSVEIVRNIIPNVSTDRNWVTVNQFGHCFDHSIVFIHNNRYLDAYTWLRQYRDLVLVCGVPSTCQKVAHLGVPVYLPLSVDVAEVSRYRRPKTRDTAYFGRPMKAVNLPDGTDVIGGVPREEMLEQMAGYRRVYAVGRCAIEARVLGCEVLPYDPRYPNPDVWKVLDNAEAAVILQRLLDEADGRPE